MLKGLARVIVPRSSDSTEPPNWADVRRAFFAEGLTRDRVQMTLNFAPVSGMTAGVTGWLVYYYLVQVINPVVATAWVLLITLISAFGFIVQPLFRDHPRLGDQEWVVPRLTIGVVLGVLPWSWLGWVIAAQSQGTPQMIMSLGLLFVSFGSTMVVGALPLAAILSLWTVIIPFATLSYLGGAVGFGNMVMLYGVLTGTFVFHYGGLINLSDQLAEDCRRQLDNAQQANQRLDALYRTDVITGLGNRVAFRSALDTLLAANGATGLAVILLDIDHFKNVNDTFGHGAGDEYLRQFAERLSGEMDAHAQAYRLGGDEFAVIITGERASSEPDLIALAARVSGAISGRYTIQHSCIVGGCSMGIATSHTAGTSSSALLACADTALRGTKAVDRGGIALFDVNGEKHHLRRTALSRELRLAVSSARLEVVYQPQIDLLSGRVHGVEALSRWRRPDGEPVSPGEFLGIAEDAGIILELCDAVITQICKDVDWLQRQQLPLPLLAYNLHPAQLRFSHHVIHSLDRLSVAAGGRDRLMLEITEDCVIGRGNEGVLPILGTLAREGYRLSLDDFGTGFASLNHLKDLPVDEIKIDRSFVSGLDSNHQDALIVSAIVLLAQAGGMGIVAEGVERQSQADALRIAGIPVGQGFHYSRPLDVSELGRYLRSRSTIASERLKA